MRNILSVVALLSAAAAFYVGDLFAQDAPGRDDPSQRDLTAYRLRVGDQIDIVVYQREDLTRAYSVPGNGEVSFPPIGKLSLLGKTDSEVEEAIARRLRVEEFVDDPKVSCIVTSYSPRRVYLLGATQGTVDLPIHRNPRLLELLAMSGALGTKDADFSRVRVLRRSEGGDLYPIDVDVSDILQRLDERKNVVVFEGDYIVVPKLEGANPQTAESVYVLGKVGNPGRHPIVRGRTGFTLAKLIAITGDFAEFADRSEVTIIRHTSAGRKRLVIDFDEIIEGNHPPVILQADDLIYVPESFF